MKQRGEQLGFILSMEAVLLFSIFGIGLLVGVVVLRDALFKYHISQQDTRFIVADSSDPSILIGDVVGFDENEAPLVVFVDYYDSVSNPLPYEQNFRTLIGVRPERMTTRQVAFYDVDGCAGPPVCLANAGAETIARLIQGDIASTGSVSYLSAIQEGPTYAVGRDLSVSTSQDLLYRSTSSQCSLTLRSIWVSQTVSETTSDSCISISTSISTGYPALFQRAEEVVIPSTVTNVLEGLNRPFKTNQIGNPVHALTRVDPDGEG